MIDGFTSFMRTVGDWHGSLTKVVENRSNLHEAAGIVCSKFGIEGRVGVGIIVEDVERLLCLGTTLEMTFKLLIPKQTYLLVAKHEVNPVMEVFTDVVAFKSSTLDSYEFFCTRSPWR